MPRSWLTWGSFNGVSTPSPKLRFPQVPIPPQEKLGSLNTSMDFEIVDKEDCVFAPPETDADVALAFTKLEEDLIAQIKVSP